VTTPEPFLIAPSWIASADSNDSVLADHAVVVRGAIIEALVPINQARALYPDIPRFDLPGHVLTPGLINLHSHAAMSLLRGIGDDLPLARWLEERIWPAEARLASAEFVADGALLAAHEMLTGGVTTFNDMYFFPEATAGSARLLGMRAVLGIIVIGFPTAYASTPDDYLRKGLELRDTLVDDELIEFCLAPHAPYSVDDPTLRRIAVLADELDLPVHIHIHETAGEIEQSLAQHGLRPLARLDRLGLVTPHLIGVHAVHLSEDEIGLLASRGASVAHCPHSNLKLASGIAPISKLLEAGVGVGLGTDGSASNNRLDLLGEARTATLLAKGTSARAEVWPAARVLRSLTIDAARALGLETRLGSIEKGKLADLVAFDLTSPELQPVYDPLSHLIYAAGREHVADVWVGGRSVVRKRQLVSPDSRRALEEVVTRIPMWQNLAQSA
jgi:5-methylthioadenosine/S-adenosylhomocysteine deaminase